MGIIESERINAVFNIGVIASLIRRREPDRHKRQSRKGLTRRQPVAPATNQLATILMLRNACFFISLAKNCIKANSRLFEESRIDSTTFRPDFGDGNYNRPGNDAFEYN